jgi:hypothetical protein
MIAEKHGRDARAHVERAKVMEVALDMLVIKMHNMYVAFVAITL